LGGFDHHQKFHPYILTSAVLLYWWASE
jgi:hypothetical protein